MSTLVSSFFLPVKIFTAYAHVDVSHPHAEKARCVPGLTRLSSFSAGGMKSSLFPLTFVFPPAHHV